MKINVSDQAALWYKNELGLNEGNYIRFFARYGGCSTVQSGFSLGISPEDPVNIGTSVEQAGITFFIEERDLWYFDGHDLNVDFSVKANEPELIYQKD